MKTKYLDRKWRSHCIEESTGGASFKMFIHEWMENVQKRYHKLKRIKQFVWWDKMEMIKWLWQVVETHFCMIKIFYHFQTNHSYLQHITNHADRPHVGVETNFVKIHDFGSGKFSCAEHHLIKLAANWGNIKANESLILLAVFCWDRSGGRSQSRLVLFGCRFLTDTRRSLAVYMKVSFSLINRNGNFISFTFISKWTTFRLCKYSIASQICFMKHAQARSVNTKSSSMTLSNSSPPWMLEKLNFIN